MKKNESVHQTTCVLDASAGAAAVTEERDKTAPIKLFPDSDPRYGNLAVALMELIADRGRGLPMVSVLGVIRLCEHMLIRDEATKEGLSW